MVAEQPAEPHGPVDLLAAAWLAWTRPRLATTSTRLLDRFAVKPPSGRLGLSNAYRLVARRD